MVCCLDCLRQGSLPLDDHSVETALTTVTTNKRDTRETGPRKTKTLQRGGGYTCLIHGASNNRFVMRDPWVGSAEVKPLRVKPVCHDSLVSPDSFETYHVAQTKANFV